MVLVAALVGTLLPADVGVAQNTRQEPTVRERLVSGLQVRRPSEFAFIDAVIDTANRGELPQKLVDRVFFWARSRPSRGAAPQRPIIYFQAGLMRIAKKMRITIAPTAAAASGSGGR